LILNRLSGATVTFGVTGAERKKSIPPFASDTVWEEVEAEVETTNEATTLALRLQIYSLGSTASVAIGEGFLEATEIA
jgi:hypothetical protein